MLALSKLPIGLPRAAGTVSRAPISWLVLSLSLAGCAALTNSNPPQSAKCVTNASVASFDGNRIAASCYPGAGPAIVLIHGWSQSQVVWERQVDGLRDRYTLITYDLRGHGDSSRPDTDAAFEGSDIPSRDLEAVLDHFEVDKATIVGWSFGSIVAAEAADYLGPERVTGLVLVSGTIEAGTERTASHFGPLMGRVGAMTTGGPNEREAVETFLRDSFFVGGWDEALFQRVLDANLSLTPAERGRVAKRPMRKFAATLNDSGIPILLIHGERDNVFVAESSKVAATELDHATLNLFDSSGHWPFIEEAERFNRALVGFMDKIRATTQ